MDIYFVGVGESFIKFHQVATVRVKRNGTSGGKPNYDTNTQYVYMNICRKRPTVKV